ncbi:MAG: PIN domain-containing protein, partial [Nitrospirota bacterium]|nr:PIN domain-containing protein [Nitrospirota bacterium]
DTTCWLCLINQKERARRTICVDILTHAKNGKILLYTSTLSIAEVIRPKINGVKLPKLTAEQIAKITAFFKHKYIRKITLDERIATKAVELARDYNLAPADAIHAASAITKAVDA